MSNQILQFQLVTLVNQYSHYRSEHFENEDIVVYIILFGKLNSENSFNKAMLNVSTEFILSTERFNNSLF